MTMTERKVRTATGFASKGSAGAPTIRSGNAIPQIIKRIECAKRTATSYCP
jgi:hypothetical protein